MTLRPTLQSTMNQNTRPICCLLILGMATLFSPPAQASLQDELGILVRDGFSIQQVSGPELADDIYSLAVSPFDGTVFVSGRGYIRRLIDANQDGKFDVAATFAAAPQNGAMGLCPVEDGLICTGDQGVLYFYDKDKDGAADGPPKVIVPMKTGVEHGTHAVRIGPDGKLYVLAGNATPIRDEFFSAATSPVKTPRAGFLMRMNLDGSNKEIVADGFRNAYDFDFNDAGETFVYDSDGERDISLPWYRPTRVYQVRSGDDAGWVTAGWKRPSFYLDMPRTIASLGRGSPTGVTVYRPPANDAARFPNAYNNAVLVADWTFGRIVALMRDGEGAYQEAVFARSTGQNGFAVTDLDIDRDGSLLASVGGRGTRGAVYRIRFQKQPVEAIVPPSDEAQLVRSLRELPQPSLALLVRHLSHPSQTVVTAAMEQLVQNDELVSIQGDLAQQLADKLVRQVSYNDPNRAGLVLRALESIPKSILKQCHCNDASPIAQRLLQLAQVETREQRIQCLIETCRAIQASEIEAEQILLIRIAQLCMGGCTSRPSNLMFTGYEPAIDLKLDLEQRDVLFGDLQQALSTVLLLDSKSTINQLQSRKAYFGLVVKNSPMELGRLIAMVADSAEYSQQAKTDLESTVDSVLAQLVQNADVPENPLGEKLVETCIHWLNVKAKLCSTGKRQHAAESSNETLAELIVSIPRLLNLRDQAIDRNFYPRFNHTIVTLLRHVPDLGQPLASKIEAEPSQLQLLATIRTNTSSDSDTQALLLSKLKKFIDDRPEEVTNLHLSLLVQMDRAAAGQLRRFVDRPDLQSAVLQGLPAASPQPADLKVYARALKSTSPGRLLSAAKGIRRVVDSYDWKQLQQQSEINKGTVASLASRAAGRLGWSRAEMKTKDDLVRILASMTEVETDYEFKISKPNRQQQSSQRSAIAKLDRFVQKNYPNEFASVNAGSGSSVSVDQIQQKIKPLTGDLTRGKAAYQKFRCAQCHDSGNRLGPRLEGIGKRFSQADLIRSIVDPNDSVPDRYKATVLSLADGTLVRGTVIYDSVAGIVIQKEDGMTATLSGDNIEERMTSGSLMPLGLMNEASDQDWADLIRFLQSR